MKQALALLWTVGLVPFHMLGISILLVCFKTRHFFSDIQLQKWRDLEIRVRGHSRLFRLVPFFRLGVVSY